MGGDSRRVEPIVIDEADAPADGWDDPVKGRVRWRTLFSGDGTPTDGITCGVADLEPGGWLGLHRHAPPEIYFVFAGSGVVTLNGREVGVKAGSAVFIPGMVVPAAGWSPLFLGLAAALTVLVVLPGKLARRNKAHQG